MFHKNPLQDEQFLKALDLQNIQEKYAKITLLTIDELPAYEFQGKVTQGSINIDGSSAVRRTCSLTMISQDFRENNIYWTLKNKFKLAIGIKNLIDSRYPDIIWFPMGYFVFSSLNTTFNINGYTLSIQGKDKMCLLNGELGGTIQSETDFGKYEIYKTLTQREFKEIPIKTIVRNIVFTFGQIPHHKIILNDIDDYAVELIRFKCNSQFYLFKNSSTKDVENATFEGGTMVYQIVDGKVSDSQISVSNVETFDTFISAAEQTSYQPTEVVFDKNKPERRYTVIKCKYDDDIGYKQTELTYPGDLIAKAGDSVVSILDKIKNTFADFEYFFDIDGNFVFQKKRTYVNQSWNNLVQTNDSVFAQPNAYSSAYAYCFDNNVLVSSFQNVPNFMNIKNDFSVWGTRESSNGRKYPIHMRYSIMDKPQCYRPRRFYPIKVELNKSNYKKNVYYIKSTSVASKYILATGDYDEEKEYYTLDIAVDSLLYVSEDYAAENPDLITDQVAVVDWRELIYQMAQDYYDGSFGFENPHFLKYVAEANKEFYPTGITGYEIFYSDVFGFWRQIYDPVAKESKDVYKLRIESYTKEEWLRLTSYEEKYNRVEAWEWSNYRPKKYYKLKESVDPNNPNITYEKYSRDDSALGDPDATYYVRTFEKIVPDEKNYENYKTYYSKDEVDKIVITNEETAFSGTYYTSTGWNVYVDTSPSDIDFWMDFMSTKGEIGKYSISAIGVRSKVVNSNDVTSVYLKDIPNILFLESRESTSPLSGYTPIYIGNYYPKSYFVTSPRKKSAKDEIDSLLYQHLFATENITITSLPIYHLEPNTRIYVNDTKSGINGEYILNKITIPLNYNGTSSLNATKAVERIL